MENKKKDVWDKADVILKPLGGLLAAFAITCIGFMFNSALQNRETLETNVRLYSELMGKREEAESALRKDMFKSIIESFLKPDSASIENKVLNLELLLYNFHESLNLKPLFLHLEKQIHFEPSLDPVRKENYLERLYKLAGEITRKQVGVLEGAGKNFDQHIEFNYYTGSNYVYPDTTSMDSIKDHTLELEGQKRNFKITVNQVDTIQKEVRIQLLIRSDKKINEGIDDSSMANGIIMTGETVEVKSDIYEFWVGYFDFPMIDHTRLSNDQRCAIILNALNDTSADLTLIYFPGSYASIREKPYFEELVERLLVNNDLQK